MVDAFGGSGLAHDPSGSLVPKDGSSDTRILYHASVLMP
jgi:hypothetical protein